MPVPSTIDDLSQTAGSNSPAGSESPTSADDYLRSAFSFLALLRDGKGHADEVQVASAATCDIGAANSLFVEVTGTTTITSFGTSYNGPRFVRFSGVLTLTHNASSLVCPGGANITTAAGDAAVVIPNGGTPSGWRVVAYQRASLAPGAATSAASVSGTVAIANGGTGQTTASAAFDALKQSASESATGVVELATSAEAQAGTDTARAIVPSTLRSGLNASGSAPVYACRAWVNFSGTGTPAINASGNVSSITDLGTGYYKINFTTAMPDTSYACFVSGVTSNGNAMSVYETSTTARTVNDVTIFTGSAGTPVDLTNISVAVFR